VCLPGRGVRINSRGLNGRGVPVQVPEAFQWLLNMRRVFRREETNRFIRIDAIIRKKMRMKWMKRMKGIPFSFPFLSSSLVSTGHVDT
jgi:hypothetical protein